MHSHSLIIMSVTFFEFAAQCVNLWCWHAVWWLLTFLWPGKVPETKVWNQKRHLSEEKKGLALECSWSLFEKEIMSEWNMRVENRKKEEYNPYKYKCEDFKGNMEFTNLMEADKGCLFKEPQLPDAWLRQWRDSVPPPFGDKTPNGSRPVHGYHNSRINRKP